MSDREKLLMELSVVAGEYRETVQILEEIRQVGALAEQAAVVAKAKLESVQERLAEAVKAEAKAKAGAK